MYRRIENPEWWDRFLDWNEGRNLPLAVGLLLLLWSFLVVASIRHSVVLGLCSVVSLPAVLVALVVWSRRATATERHAFAQSFSDDPAVARAAESEWRRLHAERETQISRFRRFGWLVRNPRPSFQTMVVLVMIEALASITAAVVLTVRR